MKTIPWELFFVIVKGFCTLEISEISGKERLFHGVAREIRNFAKDYDFRIILEGLICVRGYTMGAVSWYNGWHISYFKPRRGHTLAKASRKKWEVYRSASPKPHPSKPHPCHTPQAKTEVALQFSECCAAEVALQHWLFCNADVILTKSCAATTEKLHRNIEKAVFQESGAFLPLSCGFQAPTFRHPR